MPQVPDDLNALTLTAPEPVTSSRLSAGDWARVEKHAGLPAIGHHLKAAKRERDRWQRTADRWEALLTLRTAQVEAGEWPPPVERVTWGDLRTGDVLHYDADRDLSIECVTAEDGQVTIWFESWFSDGLSSVSAPADREAVIRPRGASS